MAALVERAGGALWAPTPGEFDLSMDVLCAATSPALTEQGDALTVARQRVEALLHSVRNSSGGGGSCDDLAQVMSRCERALVLFDEVDAATSAEASELVARASAKGQELVVVLGELGLSELRDSGPVSLPRPGGLPEMAVHFAQINWETDEGASGDGDGVATTASSRLVRWTDDATLAWVRFGLIHGHTTPGLMPAALCLLARVERDPSAPFENGKDSAAALDLLKEAARFRLEGMAAGDFDPNAGDAANASVVWSAICEAESMADMSAMFDLYRDPTSDDPAANDDDDDDDSDFHPEEEGPLFMEAYAACDACGTDLYLPSDQTCPGMGQDCEGLQPFTITAEQSTEEESFACDMCNKICPEGEPMRGCRDCEFDLCECCSGPWYHEKDTGRDFCGKCFTEAEGEQQNFILVTKPDDLGDEMNDYFGEDDDVEEEDGAQGVEGTESAASGSAAAAAGGSGAP